MALPLTLLERAEVDNQEKMKGYNAMTKHQNAIEWEECLYLLSRFASSASVKEIVIENNQTAYMMGRTPKDHVDLDIFVYYYGEAPSSEAQMEIAKGFIGDNGARKVWDGLNVAALWKDPSVRLYNCLLFWPLEKDYISQAEELKKIGFISTGEPGRPGYVNSYIFKKTSGTLRETADGLV